MSTLLIKNARYIVSCDDRDTLHEHSNLFIRDNAIEYIGPELREALGRCRTHDTAALVNRIGILLTPEQVFQDMEQVHAELTAAYPLPDIASYFGHIEYIRYDPSEWEEGFLKLVSKAFIRHGYNLLPAISQIEEDAGSQLAAFQKAFDTQAAISISKHITAPVQAKLPILRELLERGAD